MSWRPIASSRAGVVPVGKLRMTWSMPCAGQRRDPVRAVGEIAGDHQLVDPPVGQLGREPLDRAGRREQLLYLAGQAQRLEASWCGPVRPEASWPWPIASRAAVMYGPVSGHARIVPSASRPDSSSERGPRTPARTGGTTAGGWSSRTQ